MRYVVDTHVLLWSIGQSELLSDQASAILSDLTNEILVSVVSLWEVSLKYGLGKLVLGSITPGDIPAYCKRLRYEIAPIDADDAATYHDLRRVESHRDPFDRMLIHQCIRKKAFLISKDRRMYQYEDQGLRCIW